MDPLMLAIIYTCIVVYIPYIPDAYTPYLHIHVHVTQLYTAYSLRVIEDVTYVLHLFRLCPITSILFFSYF